MENARKHQEDDDMSFRKVKNIYSIDCEEISKALGKKFVCNLLNHKGKMVIKNKKFDRVSFFEPSVAQNLGDGVLDVRFAGLKEGECNISIEGKKGLNVITCSGVQKK